MRTLFTIGVTHNPYFVGQARVPLMGQAGVVLSTDEAQKLFNDLDLTSDKLTVVNDWKKNHPNLERDLGNDYGNWQFVAQDEAMYGSAAEGLRDRLQEQIGEKNPSISVEQGDLDAAKFWIAAVNRLYTISANHTGRPLPPIQAAPLRTPSQPGVAPPTAPPGTLPPASTIPVTPIVVGVGALAIFGLILFTGRS